MPVLGAVVVLRPGAGPDALPADPRLLMGELQGHQLPIALEVGGRREAQAVWDELLALPDVLDVQLAFASYEDLTDAPNEVSS